MVMFCVHFIADPLVCARNCPYAMVVEGIGDQLSAGQLAKRPLDIAASATLLPESKVCAASILKLNLLAWMMIRPNVWTQISGIQPTTDFTNVS